MKLQTFTVLLGATVLFLGCDDDDDGGMMPCAVEGGMLTGGPFAFTLDGLPDAIDTLTLEGASGASRVYLVTDADGTILGIQPTLDELRRGVDFDQNDAGTCNIYNMSFQTGVVGADVGLNLADVTGCFELSNAIEVARTPCPAVGGTLDSTSFAFVIDGTADFLSGIELSGAEGDEIDYVLTGADTTLISVIDDLDSLTAVDFDAFDAGDYLVWALARNSDLVGADAGAPVGDVAGCFALSNALAIGVTCPAAGGKLTGGPFLFRIDGTADFLGDDELGLTDAVGETTVFVVTDEEANILAIPEDYAALQEVNFDDAGTGQCLIWSLSFTGALEGAEVGQNAGDIVGCFGLSNSILVQRVCTASGGRLSGGPLAITADTIPDFINTDLVVLSGVEGQATTFVVTSADSTIVALPPDLAALDSTNLDDGAAGTSLIWHLSANGEITGAEIGNTPADIRGCWDLSNPIEVTRTAP